MANIEIFFAYAYAYAYTQTDFIAYQYCVYAMLQHLRMNTVWVCVQFSKLEATVQSRAHNFCQNNTAACVVSAWTVLWKKLLQFLGTFLENLFRKWLQAAVTSKWLQAGCLRSFWSLCCSKQAALLQINPLFQRYPQNLCSIPQQDHQMLKVDFSFQRWKVAFKLSCW